MAAILLDKLSIPYFDTRDNVDTLAEVNNDNNLSRRNKFVSENIDFLIRIHRNIPVFFSIMSHV